MVCRGAGDNRLEPLVLPDAERRTLRGRVTRRKTVQELALWARIVLAWAEGRSNTAVSARLGINRSTATRWRARFLAGRLDGLSGDPRDPSRADPQGSAEVVLWRRAGSEIRERPGRSHV